MNPGARFFTTSPRSFNGTNVSHRNIPIWGGKERFVYYNAGNGHVVVIAPPLGGGYEKNTNLSLELYKKDVSSISLDYNGFRKEGGSLNRFNIDSTINDYCRILQFAKERYDHISIAGSCFGASAQKCCPARGATQAGTGPGKTACVAPREIGRAHV